ncbi:hypothetical protein [Thermofilum sp.]|jgi:hypothetical protein|uniref:hypothetical protein n=1 Tax=Thermofilum sp. TaxID=1961369 RepID=UPI0025827648|nr:hypothetical protein [Thermofilum sp.]
MVRWPRRALLVALFIAVLIVVTVIRADPSGENWQYGDKNAVDYSGKGQRYAFGISVTRSKQDPYYIVINPAWYDVESSLSGGNYTWNHGDDFYIDADSVYSATMAKVIGNYSYLGAHYIDLVTPSGGTLYKDSMAFDVYFEPPDNTKINSFSLFWSSTGRKTVMTKSFNPQVSLPANPPGGYYEFHSDSQVTGGMTVYFGSYVPVIHAWFNLQPAGSGGGGGSSGSNTNVFPFTIRVAVLNQTEAANFTAPLTMSYIVTSQSGSELRTIDFSLHSFYQPTLQLTTSKISIILQNTYSSGYIAGKQIDYKKVTYFGSDDGGYGKYLTGPYLVKFHLWLQNAQYVYYYGRSPSGTLTPLPRVITQNYYDWYGKSFQYLNNLEPYVDAKSSYVGILEWYIYNASLTYFKFHHWEIVYYTYGGSVKNTFNVTDPIVGFQPPDYADKTKGVTITAYFVATKEPPPIPPITLGLGTMYLPGEGISTPWLENVSGWAWNGTWTLNVTELYPVKEHIAMILTDGSNVKVVDLPNGTSIKVYLPAGWKNNKYVKPVGQAKVTQIPPDKDTLAGTFPAVNVSGQTWYLVALAAWNPYKQPSGYDTSCWLSNGTTLAVYNLTYTYTFKNGTRVVFKEPVVVSALKTTVTPIYSYGNMKQGLSLKVTVKWKYLPPARTGIQLQPPSSIVGVAVIGSRVYNGTLIDANATSKTFLVAITNDTWSLYTQGVTSVTAMVYWLSSMSTPEGPVALQDQAQLSIIYVMPHIDAISEGTSMQATISILDVRTNQPYSANIYIELRDNRTYSVVATYGPYYVPGQATITIDMPNTKQYVLAIYALPVPQKDKLVVPIPAVYPPRA